MRDVLRFAFFMILAVLLCLPVMAQVRGGDTSQRGTPGGTSTSTPSAPSTGTVSSAPVVSSTSTYSRNYSGMAAYNTGSYGGGYSGNYVAPDLTYTSFNSASNYFAWQNFYNYLQMRYNMNQAYFGRFYRQTEPLITPELLKLTMRQPLKLSLQLLDAVDELELMLKAGEAGKQVDKVAIAAKTQEIRELAKKIRADESLAFFDQRREKDALKLEKTDTLGLEAISQLREIATDLNTQLKNMYNMKSTSTVSVQSLTAPSFESLTKGIDKLSKAIESSARRM